MEDKLYDEFYDPSQDFLGESRAFCYELATELINQAKEATADNWYEDINKLSALKKRMITCLRQPKCICQTI